MPPVPRPHWKEAELKTPQPLWRRILLGLFEVFTVFGGARAVGVTQLPQFIRPLYYRVRLKDAVAATTPQPIQTAESEVIAAPEAIASRTHTVVKGDSLWGIAKGAYGSGQRWIDIWRLNRAKIAEADLIYPGQEFMLPDVEVHRESGARPGVSVKDVTPSMRVVETKKAPPVSTETKTETAVGTQKTGGAAGDTQVLKNKIQPQVDALSKSLEQLKISVGQYAKAEKANKVSADDLKHIASYAAEAKKLTTALAVASSKTDTINAVADLLDVARDATTTVRQIVIAEPPRGAPSLYPGGVYQTSTGAPMTLAPSTPALSAAPSSSDAPQTLDKTGRQWTGRDTVMPDGSIAVHAPGPAPEYPPGYVPPPSDSQGETGMQGPTVAPADFQLETLPAGYAWHFYPSDPTSQPDVAYPTGSGPFSIPAGYQVTHQYQTTPTQDIVGPAGDSWIFNTETGTLHPNRIAGISPVAGTTVLTPPADIPAIAAITRTPMPDAVTPMVVTATQAAVLSQTVGEQVATTEALSRTETEALINSSAQKIREAMTPSLETTPEEQSAAASALSYAEDALSKTKQAAASDDAAGAILAATMAVSGAISANVAAPNTAAAMQATNAATEAAETLQHFDQALLDEAAVQIGGDGGGAVGMSSSGGGTGGPTATSGTGGITASSMGVGASSLGAGQGDLANAAVQAIIGSITLSLAGESNLSLTQNIVALAIGVLGVVAGVPGLGVVAAGIMGSANQSQANASLTAQQQNIVTQIAYQGYRAGEINNPSLVAPVLSMISIDIEPLNVIAIQAVEAAQAAEATQSSNVNTLGNLANIGVTSSGLQGIDAAAAASLSSGIGIGGAGSIGYSGTIASVANALGISQISLIGQLAQAGKLSPEQAAKLMSQVDEDTTDVTPVDINVVAQNIPNINDLDVADPQNDPNTQVSEESQAQVDMGGANAAPTGPPAAPDVASNAPPDGPDATGAGTGAPAAGPPGVDAPGTDSGGNAPSGPTGPAATGEGDGGGPGSGSSGGPSGGPSGDGPSSGGGSGGEAP